jgi:hypothetical protein
MDLETIIHRTKSAHHWCTTSPEPPHAPLDFLPLHVREHFEHDVPRLVDEVVRLRAQLAEIA